MAGQIDIQARAVEARIEFIKSALQDFKRQNRTFNNITQLSDSLSEQIELKYNDKIHPGTLRRNKLFRTLLDKFINSAKSQQIALQESVDVSIELRQAKKKIKQLEIELDAANRETLAMNENLIKFSSAPTAKIESHDTFSNQKLIDELCHSADLIIELMQMANGFSSDLKNGMVVNVLENKTIMSRDKFPHFFKYIKKDFRL